MKARLSHLLSLCVCAAFLLSACGSVQALVQAPSVKVTILYGSEKQAWLDPLVKQYNGAQHKTADGKMIVVEATALGSVESGDMIISGQSQPTVWSPASGLYIPVENAAWRKTHSDDLITGTPDKLVLSPVVIAMWRPMAEALGWPNKALGWADIAQLAISDKGWAAFGYAEWGSFKFGHTHPNYSNSGLVSVVAEAYAATNKQRGLTAADLQDPKVQTFMSQVESSIIHYGTSTGFFADRMFKGGPSYLSAAVMYENLVAAQEDARLKGTSSQLSVVAIYPKEGTFWSDHPYAILNAPWVTAEQKEGAKDFETFLLDKPQQLKAIELGFRPADPSVPLSAPLDADHGVDVQQPKTVLEVPSADVIQAAQTLWRQTKKPVDVTVVLDISGSMGGDKIAAARNSVGQFINLLDDNDRLAINVFNNTITPLTPLTTIGPKRADVGRHVSALVEGGGTALYDAVSQAYDEMTTNGDPKHIRALVVMTDGQDTDSSGTLDELISKIGATSEEGGNAIKIFTIAFGSDADQSVLKKVADAAGGQEYAADPKTISQTYAAIATFF
jgi:Ca-activated chloride channel family protein